MHACTTAIICAGQPARQKPNMSDESVPAPDIQDVVREMRNIAHEVKALASVVPAISRLDARQEKMLLDVEVLKKAFGSMSKAGGTLGENSACTDVRTTPEEDILIKKIVDRNRALYPLLEWFIKMTVLAMVEAFPALDKWMRPTTLAQLSKVRREIVGVSGLAVILFAVDPSDDKIMYRKSTGPVWTFVVRCVFSTMISSARAELFASPESEPHWISDLGDPVRTFALLTARLSDFNSLRPLSHSMRGRLAGPSSKKRRLSQSADTESVSRLHFMQTTLIRRLKKSVCRHLTYCRHEVKIYLYEKLLFLVEMIRARGGRAKAQELGFFFTFADPSPDESHPGGEAGASSTIVELWDIARNAVPTSEAGTKEADAKNEALLREIEKRFPYLSVRMDWRRRVVHSEDDTDRDDREYHNTDLSWPATERVSLLNVAGGIFLELVRVRSLVAVMRCSEYSLMAIFVLALGLRGLLRDTLGLPMTSAEAIAKGSVHAALRGKNDNFVSVLLRNSETFVASDAGNVQDPENGSAANFASEGNTSTQAGASAIHLQDSQRLAKARKSRCNVFWNTYLSERRKGSSVIGTESAQATHNADQDADSVGSAEDPEIELLGPLLNASSNAFLYHPHDEYSFFVSVFGCICSCTIPFM